MAMDISCPRCGEADDLRGERSDDSIHVRCGSCGHEWDRDLRLRCPRCGNDDLRGVPKAVTEKARGKQRSIVATVTVHLCPECDRQALDRYLESRVPLAPDDA